ncbi:unnamed protein product [marine sediment metagenome]|uniref:Uncharacterized protein n=1 Tax=marine sediment metagenome TaxID=412755 RepID=X0TBG9_9ZZZZ
MRNWRGLTGLPLAMNPPLIIVDIYLVDFYLELTLANKHYAAQTGAACVQFD